MKTIKLTTTKDKLITHTITIFTGYYKLTDLEQRLLAYIVKHYLDLQDKIKDPILFSKNFMDSTFKASVMTEFSIKPSQLSRYISSLVTKKALKEHEGTYILDSKFIPSDKIMFEFKIQR